MSPEQKKHLLYAGGALASIAALVLFMKNKAPGNQPISSAGLGSGSAGAGGASSGTSANNAAALNAAVALGVEQSRQSNALAVAQLQSQTALQIAGLQSQTLTNQANAKTAQAALGPGGAVTAAAPAATKGLFDTIKQLLTPDSQKGYNPVALGAANALPGGGGSPDFGYSLYPESSKEGYYVLANPSPTDNFGLPDFTNYVPEPSNYVEPNGYSFEGQPLDLTGGIADYYQGSTGSGDSSWFGGAGDNSGSGGGIPYYLAAAPAAENTDYTIYE